MISIVFRAEAETDLRQIIEYYQLEAEYVGADIQADIERSLALLARHPLLGAPVQGRPFRLIVTRRYHFKIAYLAKPQRVTILGVFRFQNREQ